MQLQLDDFFQLRIDDFLGIEQDASGKAGGGKKGGLQVMDGFDSGGSSGSSHGAGADAWGSWGGDAYAAPVDHLQMQLDQFVAAA